MRFRLRPLRGKRKGIILFETLIGIVLMGIFFVTASLALLAGQQTLVRGGNRIRGFFYASRALEAIRTIPYASLAAGNGGVGINATSHQWEFLSDNPQTVDGYTTSVAIQDLSDGKRVTAITRWQENTNVGSITLYSDLADWRGAVEVGDWTTPSLAGGQSYVPQTYFTSMAFGSGGYAYVTSAEPDGKLYAFELGSGDWDTVPSAEFSIAFGSEQRGYAAAIRGNSLYVLLSSPPTSQTGTGFEIRAYDITHPGLLASNPASRILASYQQENLRPLTMTLVDTRLYVGMSDTSPSIGQVVIFDVSNSGSIVLSQEQQQYNLDGAVNTIAVSGTSAYLATSATGQELMARERYTLAARTGTWYQALSYPATGLATVGTSALLVTSGRDANGSVRIFDPSTLSVLVETPDLPAGNYGFRDIATDTVGSYAFIGAVNEYGSGDLVISETSTSTPYWLSTASILLSPSYLDQQHYTGINAVIYVPFKDRLFLLTDLAILLLLPG